ncbi:hypothetical protein C806_02173 [Lachnospiraceae bacterium 3-1]|nr:hypothetical protein C806_02173 [Lachnospiraceae bacterium 3-1]
MAKIHRSRMMKEIHVEVTIINARGNGVIPGKNKKGAHKDDVPLPNKLRDYRSGLSGIASTGS